MSAPTPEDLRDRFRARARAYDDEADKFAFEAGYRNYVAECRGKSKGLREAAQIVDQELHR